MPRFLTAFIATAVVTSLTGCVGSVTHRSGFIATAHGKIYYEESSPPTEAHPRLSFGQQAGPPIVLLHGGQMDQRMWDDQFFRLAGDFHVVRYDIRGYGQSPPADKPYFNYEDLRAVLDHLGIEKASLVGLSLGGAIAIDFTLAYPQRVEKLVAVAPGLSGFDWSSESFAGWRRITAAAQAGDAARAADLWLAEPMMVGVKDQPAVRTRVRQILVDNGRCWLNNPLLERDLDPPAAGRLKEIRAATLAIVGDRDVPDILRVVDHIEAQVPGARKVVIPGASHIVNMEKPAEFDRALISFLKERKANAASIQMPCGQTATLSRAAGASPAERLPGDTSDPLSNPPRPYHSNVPDNESPDARFSSDAWRLIHALATKDFAAATQILDASPSVICERDVVGETPLHWLAVENHVEAVGFLLDRGDAVDSETHSLDTPLISASSLGYLEMVRLLLSRGARTDTCSTTSGTPLHAAAGGARDAQIIELLVAHGADPNKTNDFGESPLHDAARRGNAAVTRRLLALGADPAAREGLGRTPLLCAADAWTQSPEADRADFPDIKGIARSEVDSILEEWEQHKPPFEPLAVIDALLSHGADVNTVDDSKSSALHLAAARGDLDLVRFLIDRGIDPSLKDDFGETAVDVARKNNHSQTVALLER